MEKLELILTERCGLSVKRTRVLPCTMVPGGGNWLRGCVEDPAYTKCPAQFECTWMEVRPEAGVGGLGIEGSWDQGEENVLELDRGVSTGHWVCDCCY